MVEGERAAGWSGILELADVIGPNMHHALVKLVAMLLLVVQGVVASATGRVMCIRVADCGSHTETVAASACEHDCGNDQQPQDDGWCDVVANGLAACECHVHVPVPGEERVPSKGQLSVSDFKTVALPVLVAMVLQWEPVWRDGPARYAERREARSWDQLGALRTTRLLV